MLWWRLLMVALAVGLVTVLAAEPTERTGPLASEPSSLFSDEPAPLITETDQRPVTIASMPCANRLQATSSGFVIDNRTVVTVAHAIFEARDFAVRDATGRWHEATLSHMDLERDLAVLQVNTLLATPAPTRRARTDDAVRMLQGAASGTTTGEVLRLVSIRTEVIGDLSTESVRSGYELSVGVKGGDSGSGVVDDDGNLVGMIFARSTRRDAAWATSIVEIEDSLAQLGLPTWECEARVRAELVLEPIETLRPY